MSKKNKRFAALITAVLVLALTVAGSLTVSAISDPDSGSYEYMEIEIGKETIDGAEYVKVSYSTPSGYTWTSLALTVALGSSTVYTGEFTSYSAQGSFYVPVASFASADYYTFSVEPSGVSHYYLHGDSTAKYIKYENGTLTVGYYEQTTTPDDFKNLAYVSQSSLNLSSSYSYTTCTYNGENYLISFPCVYSDKYCYVYEIGDDGSLSLYATKNIYGGSYYGYVNRIYCDSTNIYFAGWRVGTSSLSRSDASSSQTTYYSLADFFSRSNLYSSGSSSYGPTRIGGYSYCYYKTYQSAVYNGCFYEFYQSSSGQPFTFRVFNIAEGTSATYSPDILSSTSDFYNFQQVGSYCYWTCGTNGTRSGIYIAALNLSTLEVTYTRIDDIVSSYSTSMIAESNDSFIFLSSTPVRVNIVTKTYYTATLSTVSSFIDASSYSNNAIRFGSYIIARNYKIQYTNYLPPRLYTEAEYQAALASGGSSTSAPTAPSLSYRDGKLLWTRTDENNPVYLEYMTYTDYAGSDDNATWTPLVVGMDYTYDYWETDEYDWSYERTHNNKWVQFRLAETIDGTDVYSNIIQIDVCLTSHVVDKNNDGYDDSSYSAGYNAGSGSGACSLIHVVDNDNDTYDDVSFTAGKQAGINYQKNKSSDSGVADFVTKILGAFTGSALYVGSNISVGGVTLLTIIGIIAIGGAVIIILKVSKGG